MLVLCIFRHDEYAPAADGLTDMDVICSLASPTETDRGSKDTSLIWMRWMAMPNQPTGVVRAWAEEYLLPMVVCSCAINGLVALQSLEKHTNDQALWPVLQVIF